MIFNGSIQRNDGLFDSNASHRDEPVSGIFTVILETPVLGAYAAQVRLLLDVVAPMFVKFWVQPIFFPEQGIDQMKCGIEICRYNPI